MSGSGPVVARARAGMCESDPMSSRLAPPRLVVTVAALALLAAACGDDGGSEDVAGPDPDATTTTAAPAEDDTLDLSECFVDDDGGIGATVPCDESHTYEYAVAVDTPFDEVPDDPEPQLWAACGPALDAYLGDTIGFGMGVRVRPSLPTAATGEPLAPGDETTACLAQGPDGLELDGSVADDGLLDALPDGFVPVMLMEPLECFELYEDDFAVAPVTDCGAPGALRFLGVWEIDGGPDDPYPGTDALRAERDQRCEELAGDLGVDPVGVSGVIPSDAEWLLGLRIGTCDAEAAPA